MGLRVYSTLTRDIEDFVPRDPEIVQMFVCGPTVYDNSHAGHAKTYTQFDFIARYLGLRYRVRYLQNITDVDDKIIARAAAAGVNAREIADTYEVAYQDDMRWLGNTSVTDTARAHDFIPEIVSQVKRLVAVGAAYELDDGWYFDLSSFPDYGKLSGRMTVSPEDSVSRIDDHDHKRNPGDFALWKRAKPGEPTWDTDLGPGRPGWHIEDTAITEKFFGAQYDLHGGAIDLIFPHHEAEIAQMEKISGQVPLARYWMHTGLLRVDGAKMAKSSGNFTTIQELRARWDHRTLRYAFLSHHYRSSMELSDDVFESAQASRRRVESLYRRTEAGHASSARAAQELSAAREAFFERLDDDFDTPGALAVLFGLVRDLNKLEDELGFEVREFLLEVDVLFDAFDLRSAGGDDDERINELIRLRNQMRSERFFKEADEIRDKLAEMGILIEDTVDGTRWWHDIGRDSKGMDPQGAYGTRAPRP
jgi:cysteinyl-tRNA synthetase